MLIIPLNISIIVRMLHSVYYSFEEAKFQRTVICKLRSEYDVRIFGVEPNKQSRGFIVGSPSELFETIENLDMFHRNFYEIIEEDQPCHLYIDVEFDRVNTPFMCSRKLIDNIIFLVGKGFKDILNKDIEEDGVVILDASGGHKCSYHVIVSFVDTYDGYSLILIKGFSESCIIACL